MSLDASVSTPGVIDTHLEPLLDHEHLRRVFALFPSGIAAIAAVVDDEPAVLVASSFQVGISLDPPLVLFAAAHGSTTWPRLRAQARLGVSVLSGTQDQAALRLASRSARAERFTGLKTTTTAAGAHLIDGATAWLECSVHSEFRAGDHDLVLLQVHALGGAPETAPLIWHASGFRTLAPLALADSRTTPAAG